MLAPTTICGHRALMLGPLRPGPERPPLVLLGGTAQWLDSWTGHLSALAQKRKVLLYETAGQGGGFAGESPKASQYDFTDCTLPRHARDFAGVVHASGIGASGAPVDVVAFSFGARVAMAAAAAASAPAIRRCCITGVSADRGAHGRLALASWRASLSAGDLPGFAWRLILDTHSLAYLHDKEANVPAWIRAVTAANSVGGLRAIVEQTHTEDTTDPMHPLCLGETIKNNGVIDRGLLIAGRDDLLSPPGAGRQLADAAGFEFMEVERAGHAVPIEQAVIWRRAVLSFLDSP